MLDPGKSGVGKTTLLKSLSGLTVPTDGQIRVGEAVSQASGGAANIAEKTGLVFQFPDRYVCVFIFQNNDNDSKKKMDCKVKDSLDLRIEISRQRSQV